MTMTPRERFARACCDRGHRRRPPAHRLERPRGRAAPGCGDAGPAPRLGLVAATVVALARRPVPGSPAAAPSELAATGHRAPPEPDPRV